MTRLLYWKDKYKNFLNFFPFLLNSDVKNYESRKRGSSNMNIRFAVLLLCTAVSCGLAGFVFRKHLLKQNDHFLSGKTDSSFPRPSFAGTDRTVKQQTDTEESPALSEAQQL